MKKRLIAFLCILSLVMTNAMPVYAIDFKNAADVEVKETEEENENISESMLYVNPVYADQITEEELSKELSEVEKEEKK